MIRLGGFANFERIRTKKSILSGLGDLCDENKTGITDDEHKIQRYF